MTSFVTAPCRSILGFAGSPASGSSSAIAGTWAPRSGTSLAPSAWIAPCPTNPPRFWQTAWPRAEHRPASAWSRDEQAVRLREILDRLGPNDREVLVMCYLEELTFAEIAAASGITENAAKVRHFRAMERIRKLIESQDSGELQR